MGKSKDDILQTIVERLDTIERKQALHSLDGAVLLVMPISLFVLGLVINMGLLRMDPLVLLLPVSILGVLWIPLALYLIGMWRDDLSYRLNALLFFLSYLTLFIFLIPIYAIYQLLPYKLHLIAFSTVLIFIGGAEPSVLLSQFIAIKYIIPVYGKTSRSLTPIKVFTISDRAHLFVFAKKFSILFLIILLLGYFLPFILQ